MRVLNRFLLVTLIVKRVAVSLSISPITYGFACTFLPKASITLNTTSYGVVIPDPFLFL